MNDMLKHLNSENSPQLIAYFAHIGIIHLHLTAMGAFMDVDTLRSDNYGGMANRKWRTSEICPFTANLAAVKYHCHDAADGMYKVKFFMNQKPLDLDWCVDGLCELDDVMERYNQFYNADCSQIFCSGTSSLVQNLFYVISLMILVNRFF